MPTSCSHATSLSPAGARRVAVVQQFHREARITRDRVDYIFKAGGRRAIASDIPTFRVVAGDEGVLWRPGDVADCTRALTDAWSPDLTASQPPVAPVAELVDVETLDLRFERRGRYAEPRGSAIGSGDTTSRVLERLLDHLLLAAVKDRAKL
jgi:hypothetical protein